MSGAAKSDAELIDELASRLNLLGQRRIDPERFHVEKNDIVVQLRRLARRLAGQPARKRPTTTWRPNER